MKPLRIVLIGLASLVLLAALAVALAFTSGVQTWAARTFAPATPELTVAVGKVHAGLNVTRIENLRVVRPGLVLTAPAAEVAVSVIDAAAGKVTVKRLVAKGWTLELTPVPAAPAVTPKPEAAARTAFNGLFNQLRLPVDLAVDQVDLAGEIVLPEGRTTLAITGGGLASGREGSFAITVDFKGASTLAVRGDATARMDTPRSFDRFGLVFAAEASGPQAPSGAKIGLALSAGVEAQGEAYAATVRSGARELLRAEVKLPAGAAPLAGSWTLEATTADAAAFAMGKPLPEFEAKGRGTFSADRTFADLAAAGSLSVFLDKLGAVRPEFAALGRLSVGTGFDVAVKGTSMRLNRLDVRVDGTAPVAQIKALQPVEFNPSTGALTATDPASDVLRFSIEGLPLAWAGPFLGDLAVTGGDVRGAFTVAARDGGLSVRPALPVTFSKLSVAQAGRPLLQGLDVALTAAADYSPKGWSAEITDLSVAGATGPLLKLNAKAAQAAGEKQPLAASGAYEVSLPAVLAQPVAAGSAALSRGVARGEFTASAAAATTATLTLQLADLMAAGAVRLPAVALQARADIDAGGRINSRLPFVVTRDGRRSDLTLGAAVSRTGDVRRVSVRIEADTLHIGDLAAFAALAPRPAAPAAPAPVAATASKAPVAPLWAGVDGDLSIAIKTLVYSPELQVKDIGGFIKLTPAALTFDRLRAVLSSGGVFNAGGGLRFEQGRPQPYALEAEVALTGVETAPLLRALSPGKPSPIEGKFDVATKLSGRADDPSAFRDTIIGDIAVTSQGGTVRALDVRTSANVDNAAKVAAVAGLFGALTGNDTVVKQSDKVRAAADVTKQLTTLRYDRLSVVLGRDEKNNLAIKDLTLASPGLLLTGAGRITHTVDLPLWRQPLFLSLKLGARDQLAASLRSLGLLSAGTDSEGFAYLLEDVVLDGTLQQIGTSRLQKLLDRALVN